MRRLAVISIGFLAGPLLLMALGRTIAAVYGIERNANSRYEAGVVAAREIARAIDDYRRRYHRVPTAEQGLAALTPEFLARIPLDPWGRPFLYATTGNDFADVLSYGADGEPTGEGSDADISARYGRLGPRPPQWLRRAAVALAMALPLGAFAAAFWNFAPAAADLLVGSAFFWTALLASTVGRVFERSAVPALALFLCVVCLTGALCLLRHRRGALTLTSAGVVAVQVVLLAIIVI